MNKNLVYSIIIGVSATLAVAGLVISLLFLPAAPEPPTPNIIQQQNDSDSQPIITSGEVVTLTYTNDGYSPNRLTVSSGTTVTISNESDRSMEFSSDDHPAHQDNSEMNLSITEPGENVTYVATETGTWGYHDHLHPRFSGTITVTQ